MTKLKIGFIALLAVASLALAENLIWEPVTEATSYRVSWGVVGSGTTNVINASTNLQTWADKVRGTNVVWPGVSNVNFQLNQRSWWTVQTIVSNATTSVIYDPSVIVFYTKRTSPANVLILGE